MAHRGLAWKLAQERERWTGYFLPGNLPQLLFLIAGFFALLRAAWQSRAQLAERIWLPAGWLVGVLVLTVSDPHFVPTHLIPVIAMGYVMAGVGWGLLLAGDGALVPARQGMLALAVLATLAFGLRSAQAAFDVREGIHDGVTRAAVRSLLAKAFPGTGVTWAVGPTSIWLYVPQRGTPVIMDDRADPGIVKTALWNRVSVLVLDSDFLKWGWGRIAQEGVAAGWLKPIGHVGQPGDKYCVEAFHVEHVGPARDPRA